MCLYHFLENAIRPRTEETGLKMITTARNSNKFSRESPYVSNTFSRESPKFQAGFHLSKRSPRHSKEWTGKPSKSGDPNFLSLISSVSGTTKCICGKPAASTPKRSGQKLFFDRGSETPVFLVLFRFE